MGEWDFESSSSDGFDELDSAQQKKKASSAKGLHVILTLVCLLAVSAVSFGIAWLMKDRVRSFWEMGLTFMGPFAALMLSALFVEFKTGRMTPACSRGAQMGFAAATVVVAFVFGILAEVMHQPVVIEHVEPEYDYVIIEDKSGSMIFTDLEEPCKKALHVVIDGMEDECRVGFVAFGNEIAGQADIKALDEEQRARIGEIIDTEIPITNEGFGRMTGPGTDFSLAMDTAMAIIDRMDESVRPIRIILVTDGDSASIGNFTAFSRWADKRNGDPEKQRVELNAIQLGDPMLSMVKTAVSATGGQIFDETDPSELAEKLGSLKSTTVLPEPVDTLKATFEGKTADGKPNTPYVILTGILLLLLGLLCGISLMIMFSLHGQFRIQVILSALMGVCAFLLLNYGRYLSISPAWVCEGLAFSLFGLVFMRENGMGGARKVSVKADVSQPFDVSDDF